MLCFLFSAEIADIFGNLTEFLLGQGVQMFQPVHEHQQAFIIANLVELHKVIDHDTGNESNDKNAVKHQYHRQNTPSHSHCHNIPKTNSGGGGKTIPQAISKCGDAGLYLPDAKGNQKQH